MYSSEKLKMYKYSMIAILRSGLIVFQMVFTFLNVFQYFHFYAFPGGTWPQSLLLFPFRSYWVLNLHMPHPAVYLSSKVWGSSACNPVPLPSPRWVLSTALRSVTAPQESVSPFPLAHEMRSDAHHSLSLGWSLQLSEYWPARSSDVSRMHELALCTCT